MLLIADDREKHVIPVLKALFNIKVQRITIGDYVYAHGGKIICIVERKTLADLAASIKDGRMTNHQKLLDAKNKCGCRILYIIEGPAYPDLNRSFSRMKFKCLQGKLDSILFRHDIKIIWTRDVIHTARRLADLCNTFERLIDQGEFSDLFNDKTNNVEELKNGGNNENLKKVNSIVNVKHEVKLDMLHVSMLRQVPHVSYKAAVSALQKYTIIQLLKCDGVTAQDWYNLKNPESMYKLGNRGIKMYNACKKIQENLEIQSKILSCINGITKKTAVLILQNVAIMNIINVSFKKNAIADIKKENGRRVGNTIEDKIILAFSLNQQ